MRVAEQVTSKWQPGPDRADVHEQPSPWIILLSQRWSVFSNGGEGWKQKMQSEESKQVGSCGGGLLCWEAQALPRIRRRGARPYAPDSAQRAPADTDAEAGATCFRLEDALQF